ncbi:hypothetical protein MLD38_010257 [Melastoma candidum]|uniref:Uncharacterized protein n=1 Tax=Melastoma candidum TaxID=119954 RepID=A0ACB9QZE3_9MYRT|nr:hypothetical protein MLD38_010257 [Melastoma candidum]
MSSPLCSEKLKFAATRGIVEEWECALVLTAWMSAGAAGSRNLAEVRIWLREEPLPLVRRINSWYCRRRHRQRGRHLLLGLAATSGLLLLWEDRIVCSWGGEEDRFLSVAPGEFVLGRPRESFEALVAAPMRSWYNVYHGPSVGC